MRDVHLFLPVIRRFRQELEDLDRARVEPADDAEALVAERAAVEHPAAALKTMVAARVPVACPTT